MACNEKIILIWYWFVLEEGKTSLKFLGISWFSVFYFFLILPYLQFSLHDRKLFKYLSWTGGISYAGKTLRWTDSIWIDKAPYDWVCMTILEHFLTHTASSVCGKSYVKRIEAQRHQWTAHRIPSAPSQRTEGRSWGHNGLFIMDDRHSHLMVPSEKRQNRSPQKLCAQTEYVGGGYIAQETRNDWVCWINFQEFSIIEIFWNTWLNCVIFREIAKFSFILSSSTQAQRNVVWFERLLLFLELLFLTPTTFLTSWILRHVSVG